MPRARRARALGVWGIVGGAGAAVGVLLGGVLVELVDRRAIFFINLPVGVILAAGATRIRPPTPNGRNGSALTARRAAGYGQPGGLVYAISQAENSGWTSTQTLGIGAAATAALGLFAVFELRTTQPLLDRAIGGGFVMMLSPSAVLFGAFLLSSLYL